MADQDNKEPIKNPEKIIPAGEQVGRFEQNPNVVPEKKIERGELSPDDKIVSDTLRKEIELMQVDESTKKEAEKKAEMIEFLGEKEKIKHLLQMAREKGVLFAIQVARKMNEPYLLDILHDTLAQEGFYLKMGQVSDDNKT